MSVFKKGPFNNFVTPTNWTDLCHGEPPVLVRIKSARAPPCPAGKVIFYKQAYHLLLNLVYRRVSKPFANMVDREAVAYLTACAVV